MLRTASLSSDGLGGSATAAMRDAAPATWHHGARVRPSRSQSRQGADRALVTDRRGLDGIALSHHGQERDDPVMREIDLLDEVALLLQNGRLLEHDVLEDGARATRTRRPGSAGQAAGCAGRTRAIQLHLRSSPSSSRIPQAIEQRSDHASARAGEIGTPPAWNLSVRYPTKMLQVSGRSTKIRPQQPF